MAERKNPFTLNVKLNVEAGTVDIEQFRKTEGEAENELIGSRSYKVADLPPGTRAKNDLYGLSKKLQDSTSASSMLETRLQDMDEVMDRLVNDQWDKPREAGGPTVSAEVEALAEMKGVDIATIQKSLREQPPEVREKILNHERVKALATEIRARREETGTISLDDLAA